MKCTLKKNKPLRWLYRNGLFSEIINKRRTTSKRRETVGND